MKYINILRICSIVTPIVILSIAYLINKKNNPKIISVSDPVKNEFLIKPIEQFSITQRKFLKTMNTCFESGKAVNEFKNCEGLQDQFIDSMNALVKISSVIKDGKYCDSTAINDIQSFMVIINQYKMTNAHFLGDQLRNLEAHLKSKCKI